MKAPVIEQLREPITAGYDPLNQGEGRRGPPREYRCEAVVNYVGRDLIFKATER